MLWLLAEGLSDVEIAARLNLSDMQVRLVKSTLLNTFGAADTERTDQISPYAGTVAAQLTVSSYFSK
jgi:DNA-binding NarL/FixJ family response regulator